MKAYSSRTNQIPGDILATVLLTAKGLNREPEEPESETDEPEYVNLMTPNGIKSRFTISEKGLDLHDHRSILNFYGESYVLQNSTKRTFTFSRIAAKD